MSEKKVIEDIEEFHILPVDFTDMNMDAYLESIPGKKSLSMAAWSLIKYHKLRFETQDAWHPFNIIQYCEWTGWTLGFLNALDELVEMGYLAEKDGSCHFTEDFIVLCFNSMNRSES